MKLAKMLLVLLLGALFVFSVTTGAFAKGGKRGGKVREYWIAAEERDWSYAPAGFDLLFNRDLIDPWDCTVEPFLDQDPCTLTIPKVRYIEYTKDFGEEVKQPEWLGVLGPMIRAEVGDTVVVHFQNRTDVAKTIPFKSDYGIHPHGFRYDKPNEGAVYFGVNNGGGPGAGAQIPPGKSFTYKWFADKDSGPGSMDPSSLVWWYHSHIDEPFETNLGLLGPIVIVRKGWAKEVEWPAGSGLYRPVPRDVDKEFVACYFIFDEAGGEEAGLMHGINGYVFGNLKGLIMDKGDQVRWYNMGMGNEVDLHTAHWHGKVVRFGNRFFNTKTDVVELLPGSMKTVTMTADNKGEWIMHCHVADHIDAGMLTTFVIN